MRRGPVEVLVLAFPLDAEPASVVAAVRQPVESGVVRLIDLVLLLRAADGTVEFRDVEEGGLPEGVADLAFDPHTLLNDDDLDLIVEAMPADQQAAVLVLEHVWAREAAEEIAKAGGELALYARVPAPDVEAAFASV